MKIELVEKFKKEARIYRLVMAAPETPRLAKVLLGVAIGYAFLPFDLIPDFVPILGLVDDVIIVPGLIWLALRFVPKSVVERCREAIEKQGSA
jgi:uncharacterized membrane protein YkvA (DUF1232 family)